MPEIRSVNKSGFIGCNVFCMKFKRKLDDVVFVHLSNWDETQQQRTNAALDKTTVWKETQAFTCQLTSCERGRKRMWSFCRCTPRRTCCRTLWCGRPRCRSNTRTSSATAPETVVLLCVRRGGETSSDIRQLQKPWTVTPCFSLASFAKLTISLLPRRVVLGLLGSPVPAWSICQSVGLGLICPL